MTREHLNPASPTGDLMPLSDHPNAASDAAGDALAIASASSTASPSAPDAGPANRSSFRGASAAGHVGRCAPRGRRCRQRGSFRTPLARPVASSPARS
jgi:hypothetical protein